MSQSMIERMLRIMKMLTANTMYTVNDIAERLEVSQRTVYRYINAFRDSGFVVKKQGNYVRLDKSTPYFKEISELIHFTEEEAFILKSAIESIDDNNIFKQNLKKKLYTVYDYKILAETIVNKKDSKNVKHLVDAIEDKKQVILRSYSSPHGETIRDRIVEPFGFTTNYVQVWCYDTEERKNKLFKTVRINTVEPLDLQWQHMDFHRKGDIDIFRFSSDLLFPIRLKLNLQSYCLLIEEFPLAAKYTKKVSKNHWILKADVCSFEGVARFVMGLWDDIEIIESQELKDYIRAKVKRMSNHINSEDLKCAVSADKLILAKSSVN